MEQIEKQFITSLQSNLNVRPFVKKLRNYY